MFLNLEFFQKIKPFVRFVFYLILPSFRFLEAELGFRPF